MVGQTKAKSESGKVLLHKAEGALGVMGGGNLGKLEGYLVQKVEQQGTWVTQLFNHLTRPQLRSWSESHEFRPHAGLHAGVG